MFTKVVTMEKLSVCSTAIGLLHQKDGGDHTVALGKSGVIVLLAIDSI